MYESFCKRDYCKLQNYTKCWKNSFRFGDFKDNCVQMAEKVQKFTFKWLQMGWYKKKIHKAQNYPLQDYFSNITGHYFSERKYAFGFQEDKIHAWNIIL